MCSLNEHIKNKMFEFHAPTAHRLNKPLKSLIFFLKLLCSHYGHNSFKLRGRREFGNNLQSSSSSTKSGVILHRQCSVILLQR